MKVINSSFQVLTPLIGDQIMKAIELAGRTCYQSFGAIEEGSAERFIRMLIKRGHESVIEHQSISVRFINDRGVSHEEVRHRIATFSQESTRFINYTKENKGGQCTFIDISKHLKNPGVSFDIWHYHMWACEDAYKAMIDAGEPPEIARSVLPNSLKTEIVITANLREWRLILKQRTSAAAHPQIREVMQPLLDLFKSVMPPIFEDIKY